MKQLWNGADLVSFLDDATVQHPGEYSFMRHNTVTDTLLNRTAMVTFFSDLSHFEQNVTASQYGSDRQSGTVNTIYQKIFTKCAVRNASPLQIEFLNFLPAQQADLTMPASGMSIPFDTPVFSDSCTVNILFFRPFG